MWVKNSPPEAGCSCCFRLRLSLSDDYFPSYSTFTINYRGVVLILKLTKLLLQPGFLHICRCFPFRGQHLEKKVFKWTAKCVCVSKAAYCIIYCKRKGRASHVSGLQYFFWRIGNIIAYRYKFLYQFTNLACFFF